jgi:hypothetical protein
VGFISAAVEQARAASDDPIFITAPSAANIPSKASSGYRVKIKSQFAWAQQGVAQIILSHRLVDIFAWVTA